MIVRIRFIKGFCCLLWHFFLKFTYQMVNIRILQDFLDFLLTYQIPWTLKTGLCAFMTPNIQEKRYLTLSTLHVLWTHTGGTLYIITIGLIPRFQPTTTNSLSTSCVNWKYMVSIRNIQLELYENKG